MADFVLLGEAVHKALHINDSFKEVFLRNRTESLRRSLESSPVALAVQDLISVRKEYSGTIKQLKGILDDTYHQQGEGWPKSPRGLSEALKRTAPALREIGIDIEFQGHQRDGSHISIKRLLLSENNRHNDHIVTVQPKTKEIQPFCDGVTVVTNDFGKLKNPNGDIQARSEYNVVKYGE